MTTTQSYGITESVLTAMYENFSTLFRKGFDNAQTRADLLAMKVPSKGRAENYPWLGKIPNMTEWLNERSIKNLAAYAWRIENSDYEQTISVDRNDILDDQLGVYAPLFQEMGAKCALHPDQLLADLLSGGFSAACYDEQNFFSTDHPYGEAGGSTQANTGGGASTAWYLLDLSRVVKPFIWQVRQAPQFVRMDKPTDDNVFNKKQYLYGVDDRKALGYGLYQFAWGDKNTLNSTNFKAAYEGMLGMKDDMGRPLGVTPTHLVVPPSLYSEARQLIEAERNSDGSSNIWYKSVEMIVWHYLA